MSEGGKEGRYIWLSLVFLLILCVFKTSISSLKYILYLSPLPKFPSRSTRAVFQGTPQWSRVEIGFLSGDADLRSSARDLTWAGRLGEVLHQKEPGVNWALSLDSHDFLTWLSSRMTRSRLTAPQQLEDSSLKNCQTQYTELRRKYLMGDSKTNIKRDLCKLGTIQAAEETSIIK